MAPEGEDDYIKSGIGTVPPIALNVIAPPNDDNDNNEIVVKTVPDDNEWSLLSLPEGVTEDDIDDIPDLGDLDDELDDEDEPTPAEHSPEHLGCKHCTKISNTWIFNMM